MRIKPMKLKRGERVTSEKRTMVRRHVVNLYRAKYTVREIYTATNRSYGFIHRLLVEAERAGEIVLRQRGDHNPRKTQ